MPLGERRQRHEALFANLCDYDIDRWHSEFVAALQGLRDVAAGPHRIAAADEWPRSSAA